MSVEGQIGDIGKKGLSNEVLRSPRPDPLRKRKKKRYSGQNDPVRYCHGLTSRKADSAARINQSGQFQIRAGRLDAAALAVADRADRGGVCAGGDDAAEAVRAGAPKSEIIVDANEGWSADVYGDLAPHLLRLGVSMVEQPMPAGHDDMLGEIARPLPVCADESCHDTATLAGLKGKYDMVNIKLDKTGGLTEALKLNAAARAEGYGVMVGCMVGSSLAMAPATIVAQGAQVVDLDGPLLLAEDRDEPLKFDEDGVHPPVAALWG